MHTHSEGHPTRSSSYLGQTSLVVSALGVVFGDIGTSPLYALRESFQHTHLPITAGNVFGILSLMFWSLTIVVSIKYLLFVMSADNRGEGGVLALTALTSPRRRSLKQKRAPLLYLGLFGAALLFGDGILTPAVSILSAVEGLKVATPVFSDFVVPITIGILILLFLAQRFGTEKIGKVFGPVMVVWFFTIGTTGAFSIFSNFQVLEAINPYYAVAIFFENGWLTFAVMGSVFLCVTGAEALYADMGHLGRKPIRKAWLFVAFPALLLNYFGQGALLLRDPTAVDNPFFKLVPDWGLYPLVILSTIAAVIASQALITGVFSMTRQAIQLGYSPRISIVHTSDETIGQIYIPKVNWALLVLTIWVVIEFKSSSELAGAYGIAVALTMTITTILTATVARRHWKWPSWLIYLVIGCLVCLDFIFLGANGLKIAEGGWFPLVMGVAIFILMTTWKTGRLILAERLREQSVPISQFIEQVRLHPPARVRGSAVFMSGDSEGTPPALLHNVKHNKVLHERVALLTISNKGVPLIEKDHRIKFEVLSEGLYRINATYGFIEKPDIREILKDCQKLGFDVPLEHITFFLGRETLIPSKHPGMAIWRENLFAIMSKNAERATSFFNIPTDQVIEVGLQVEI